MRWEHLKRELEREVVGSTTVCKLGLRFLCSKMHGCTRPLVLTHFLKWHNQNCIISQSLMSSPRPSPFQPYSTWRSYIYLIISEWAGHLPNFCQIKVMKQPFYFQDKGLMRKLLQWRTINISESKRGFLQMPPHLDPVHQDHSPTFALCPLHSQSSLISLGMVTVSIPALHAACKTFFKIRDGFLNKDQLV